MTRTDLRSLEWLLAVAAAGSIGAAARQLKVAQPSVTERLRRLEQHLRLSLLQRSARGTELTAEGAAVADWAHEVLAASDRLEAGIAALRHRHDSQLRVAASMTIAEYLLPHWLAEMRQTSPHTSVALRVCNSEQVIKALNNDEADVGFIEGPHNPAELHSYVVARDELVVAVAAGHELTRHRNPLTPEELRSAPLILREPGSGTREAFEQAVAGAGEAQALAPHLELGSTAALRAAVLTSQGAGVLSRLAVQPDIDSGTMHTLPLTGIDLRRTLRLVWPGSPRLHGPAATLARCARPAPGGIDDGSG